MKSLRSLGFVSGVALVALVAACSPDGTLDPTILDLEGQVTVRLHDQAGPGIAEAHVSFSSVELREVTTGDWISLGMGGVQTHDLLELVNGKDVELASGVVQVSAYDALRVGIIAVRVVLDDGSQRMLPVPTGPVTVDSMPLTLVIGGAEVTITLDFPVDTSFQFVGPEIDFQPQIVVESVE